MSQLINNNINNTNRNIKNNNYKHSKNDTIKYVKCGKCKGYGQIEVEVIRCEICSSLSIYGCINCKSGYLSEPFIECPDCDGHGSISFCKH